MRTIDALAYAVMTYQLSLFDVAAQVLVAIAFHAVVGDSMTVLDVSARAGLMVPIALALLWVWRAIDDMRRATPSDAT